MNPISDLENPAFKGLIGVAQADISPPEGIYARNWGAAKHETAKGLHKPLTLTCCVFQKTADEAPLVLVGLDLGWWKNAAYENELRKRVLQRLNLHESRLMCCLSHTHAGPGICPDDREKPGGHLIIPYLDFLENTLVKTAETALENRQEAVLSWAYGVCNLAANRDLPDPEQERLLTGYNPTEPADDTLLVGKITDLSGEIRGTLVNYACHPTTLAWENELISPDYIGAMRELIEATTGAPCLFLQGASGELAPPEQFTGSVTLADRFGRQLGYSVLATLESMLQPEYVLRFRGVVESGASLGIWRETQKPAGTALEAIQVPVDFELKAFPTLAQLNQELAEATDPVLRERAWRKRCIRLAIGDGETASIPLWIWKLGNAFLVGQPNEPYSDFQLALRKQLPGHAVAVMNLTNGSYGYLPPPERYSQHAYPVWQTPFAAGSLEKLTEAACTLTLQMATYE